MRTAPLGTTGEEISALSLGTLYFGSRIDRETAFAFLDRYYEAGGRFLDTANIYATWVDGHEEPASEPVLGAWLDERGVRDEMTVATKIGLEYGYGGKPAGLDPALIEREIDRSRDRIGIETIDLLYAHVDDPSTPQAETMRAFQEAIDDGKVRHLGASNLPAWRIARTNAIARERGYTPYECVQPRFSYLIPNRGADFGTQLPATDELIDYCERHELTILPYSPTLQGYYGRDDRRMPEQYVNTENRLKRDVVEELAERKGVDGNTIVLAWMLAREHPTVPVIVFSTHGQLERNLAALDVECTPTERRRLDGIETYGL